MIISNFVVIPLESGCCLSSDQTMGAFGALSSVVVLELLHFPMQQCVTCGLRLVHESIRQINKKKSILILPLLQKHKLDLKSKLQALHMHCKRISEIHGVNMCADSHQPCLCHICANSIVGRIWYACVCVMFVHIVII